MLLLLDENFPILFLRRIRRTQGRKLPRNFFLDFGWNSPSFLAVLDFIVGGIITVSIIPTKRGSIQPQTTPLFHFDSLSCFIASVNGRLLGRSAAIIRTPLVVLLAVPVAHVVILVRGSSAFGSAYFPLIRACFRPGRYVALEPVLHSARSTADLHPGK